jgi:hypothetical protein
METPRRIPGYNIIRTAPFKPKAKEYGVHYTNMFITINTNYSPKNEADYNDMTARIRELLDVLYNPNDMTTVFDFTGNHSEDTWNPDVILAAKAESGIELGGKQHRIHVHTLIQIKHKTNLFANWNRIRTFMNTQLAPKVKGVKVHIKRAQKSNALDYVRKDQSPLSEAEIIRYSKQAMGWV